MLNFRTLPLFLLTLALGACAPQLETTHSFQDDVNFLSRNTYTVVLTDLKGQARIAVVPRFQGAVMTSTAEGTRGQSFGYLNYDAITAHTTPNSHFNIYGGEDRISVGPSGGQYSINFPAGSDFTPENLQVPAALDREPFVIVEQAGDHISFQKKLSVTNYSNKTFQLQLNRSVRILTRDESWHELGTRGSEDLTVVAFETKNQLVNASHTPWRKEEGLLNLSVTGMFARTTDTALIFPTLGRAKAEPGVTALPAALITSAQRPGKTGLPPKFAKGLAANFDPATSTLTIIQFMPIQPNGLYMNADWKIQPQPYAGDAASTSGGPNNPFFMLSTSSPAFELEGWQSAEKPFTVRTFHIRGRVELLDPVARAVLGVSIADINSAVPATTPK